MITPRTKAEANESSHPVIPAGAGVLEDNDRAGPGHTLFQPRRERTTRDSVAACSCNEPSTTPWDLYKLEGCTERAEVTRRQRVWSKTSWYPSGYGCTQGGLDLQLRVAAHAQREVDSFVTRRSSGRCGQRCHIAV